MKYYNQFEETPFPEIRSIRETLYWYASDYCDVLVADRIKEQVCPEDSLAVRLIRESDLSSPEYLYQFGEYISENEEETVRSWPASGRRDPEDGGQLYGRLCQGICEHRAGSV